MLVFAAFSYLNYQGFDSSTSSIVSIFTGTIAFFTPGYVFFKIYTKRENLYKEPYIKPGEKPLTIDKKIRIPNYKFRNFWNYLDYE